MTTAANNISHVHQHEKKINLNDPNLPKNNSGTWGHDHYHSHSFRQSYSQAYVFEHKHPHVHDAGVPKHVLTDMQPEDKATVRAIYGRPSFDSHLHAIQMEVGAVITNVNKRGAGLEWEFTMNGQLQTITVDEAAAIIVEVQ
ncbi:MAG: hypothetical protein Q4F00_04345 [bacterium]|nr:hypothetical protein [bacterium]